MSSGSVVCVNLKPLAPDPQAYRDALHAKIAANLLRLRTKRGWSQRQLAHVYGTDRTYISSMEGGKSMPTLWSLDRFARAFGVDIAELLR